jgi:hypothetical protein
MLYLSTNLYCSASVLPIFPSRLADFLSRDQNITDLYSRNQNITDLLSRDQNILSSLQRTEYAI